MKTSSRRPSSALAEHLLGAAVHRRGVEDARAAFVRGLDDLVGDLLAVGPEVERQPGAEPDNGHLDPGLSKASALHTMGAMPATSLLEAPELAAERIDARASGENFPVVSVLAPRHARPHLRAIYGFARLVDNLGDEAHGDRMVAPRRARARAGRSAAHRDHAAPARDDRRLRAFPRPVSAPDRGEPDRPAQDSLCELGGGAGVLHLLGRPGGRASSSASTGARARKSSCG